MLSGKPKQTAFIKPWLLTTPKPKETTLNRHKHVPCVLCGEPYDRRRRDIAGINHCYDCGDIRAEKQRNQWCIAPVAHKQGATLVTRKSDLLGLNKYMGEV